MLSWQWPWLILLAPLPWVLRNVLPATRDTKAAIKVPFFHALLKSEASISSSSYVLAIAVNLIWFLLLLAIMRPVWFGDTVSVPSEGRDLMLAVDLSDSMKTDDMLVDSNYVTRIVALKKVVGEFIQRRAGDRIGLILFGQRSYLITPLTFDHRSVRVQLDEALPGFAGSSTAIGDAIGLAISTLRDRANQSKVVILLTDGSNTSGADPQEALQVASEAGIRIHTVGIGASTKDIIDFAGRERTINPAKDLDEVTLQEIASATGGEYFRAENPRQLEAIYASIDKLEPHPEPTLTRITRSLYHWPLALAFILSLILLLPKGSLWGAEQ